MASDGEDRVQREHRYSEPNWLEKAAAERPIGRFLASEEVAKPMKFLASDDPGMISSSVIEFAPSVCGAYLFASATPESKMTL